MEYSGETFSDENGIYTQHGILEGILNFTQINSSSNSIGIATEAGVSLDPSLFKYNPNGFNIFNACKFLLDRAYPRYIKGLCGYCARAVRQALEAGGLSTAGRPGEAKYYVNFLPKLGFKHIGTYTRANEHTYSPQPGDIACYPQVDRPDRPGHICMFTGTYWVSDYIQRRMMEYGPNQYAYIFRFQS